MNLLDTYVSEVGRQLPAKNRSDIEAEIRSALQDMLDERAGQTGKPVDDEMTLAILQTYGSPEKVAASYKPERYIIGPRLYPAYIKVVQIVLPIMGVLALLGLGFSLGRADMTVNSIFEVMGKAFSEFFGSMISALGSITLIFAILERFVPDLKTAEAKWDAHSLLKVTPPDMVKPVELVVEIFFTGLAIVIFNFWPDIIGFTPSLNSVVESGDWQSVISVPILSKTFMGYIPLLTALWVLTIVLDSILIQRGRWETWSRWFLVGVKAMSIGLAVVMLAGPSLIGVTAGSLVAAGFFDRTTADILVTMMNQGVRVALVLTIIFGGLDMVKAIIRLVRVKAPVMVVK